EICRSCYRGHKYCSEACWEVVREEQKRQVRIPDQVGGPFRTKVDTHSGPSWRPIPGEGGYPFRTKLETLSGIRWTPCLT
ncbi:MAG: hypothetical protein JXA57_18230, partial [Armatimonadetes bacterium]|nr:hypothetical protein [Armatimonadota bacterium]